MKKNTYNQILKKISYIEKIMQDDFIVELPKLPNNNYFELNKKEIDKSFIEILTILKNWKEYSITEIYQCSLDYKRIEGLISELELCLAEHENKLKLNAVSYNLFEIGKLLIIENKKD